jgi:SAM-dependent methyltransferase
MKPPARAANAEATNPSFEFEALQEARNYRAALLQKFRPYLRGRVLEVGAGVGQFTRELKDLQEVEELVALEPDKRFIQELQRSIPTIRIFEGTVLELRDCQWNALVSVNVLEHIKEDQQELECCHQLLKNRGGYLCLFVPARREIYSPLDKDFGHYRRYSRAELGNRLQAAGFKVVTLEYFNFIGYFAWWWSFCVLRGRKFNPGAVKLYDRWIFPVGRSMEKIIAPPIGQSLIAVAQAC